MDETLTTRLHRIDEAIAAHHDAELRAVWANHDIEVEYHVSEVDRLLGLRFRVQQRAAMTGTGA
jgi:hypothetical protein